jgi:hypothetical protein
MVCLVRLVWFYSMAHITQASLTTHLLLTTADCAAAVRSFINENNIRFLARDANVLIFSQITIKLNI